MIQQCILDGPIPTSGVSFYGLKGTINGFDLNGVSFQQDDDELPNVTGEHKNLKEKHVFSDIMQLVDWILYDKKSTSSAEHARHVIEIFEAGYESARTGKAVELTTTFETLSLEEL